MKMFLLITRFFIFLKIPQYIQTYHVHFFAPNVILKRTILKLFTTYIIICYFVVKCNML